MAVADRKMHNRFSFMQIHAQNMQKSVLEKNRYANLSTEAQPRSALERRRTTRNGKSLNPDASGSILSW